MPPDSHSEVCVCRSERIRAIWSLAARELLQAAAPHIMDIDMGDGYVDVVERFNTNDTQEAGVQATLIVRL